MHSHRHSRGAATHSFTQSHPCFQSHIIWLAQWRTQSFPLTSQTLILWLGICKHHASGVEYFNFQTCFDTQHIFACVCECLRQMNCNSFMADVTLRAFHGLLFVECIRIGIDRIGHTCTKWHAVWNDIPKIYLHHFHGRFRMNPYVSLTRPYESNHRNFGCMETKVVSLWNHTHN